MKQNDVHKVIILYLYIRGRNDLGDETTRGTKRLVGAKRLGGKRLGGQTCGNCNCNVIVMNYIFKVMQSNL